MGEHRITASYGTDAMLINYNLNYDLSAAKMKTLSPMGSREIGRRHICHPIIIKISANERTLYDTR